MVKWTKIERIVEGKPSFRKNQVKNWVFKKLITSWENASSLPKSLRKELAEKAPLKIEGKVLKGKKISKARIKLGNKDMVETVLMKHGERNTVCVSSQVGCPVGCTFCLTGKKGFFRNLKWEEIVNQILFFERSTGITNVVFMGMGEPFLNYKEVIKAARFINQPDTFNIGARKISISTIGIPEKIIRFAEESFQANLAFSLHAPDNKLRTKLIPINEKYPLEEILKSLKLYLDKTNRKIMIEYVLINGVNDSRKKALKTAKLLKEYFPLHLFMVNLIIYNPTQDFKPSSIKNIENFKMVLEQEEIEVTIREKIGKDVKGACGQLAANF